MLLCDFQLASEINSYLHIYNFVFELYVIDKGAMG